MDPSNPVLTTSALDEALERVSGLEFPPPARFVSHAPMACEALSALGYDVVIDEWARRFEASLAPAAPAQHPRFGADVDWPTLVGNGLPLGELVGYFEESIDGDGWDTVVRTWVPRLAPGLSSALFHGVIRTAHAVRALGSADTSPRRTELARALASWASWSPPARASTDVAVVDGDRTGTAPATAALTAAARGARCFIADPNILLLHGVTGAMAVHLLVPNVSDAAADAMVGQLQVEHDRLYRGARVAEPDAAGWDDGAPESAATGGDPHEVKLVEACRRGFEATGDGAFATAARVVVGLDGS